MFKYFVAILVAVFITIPIALAETTETRSPGVYFENLQDQQVVSSPVFVKMGVVGKTIGAAGIFTEGVGHHHIVIDGTPAKEGEVVPADANHIHFGKGQTETEVILTPGKHKLTLQLADGFHRSYGEAWSKTIEVIVK